MSRSLFSYVVRYDSGFAPNPFHGYCTLATCKPLIRKRAEIDDWILGTCSDAKDVRRGGYLNFAMRITEIISTSKYWHDPRFQDKKPNMYHSWVAASGDNIYVPVAGGNWDQCDSYHSGANGTSRLDHIKRDTKVPRILVSHDFVYFGGEGPKLPDRFLHDGPMNVLRVKRGYQRIRSESVISSFENWIRSLNRTGYQGKPIDWINRRKVDV